LTPYITRESNVIEIGCGTGYYGMHFAPQCNTYLGVDIAPAHAAKFQEKIEQANIKNAAVQIGDATNLIDIPAASFDVVLVLGPMYHLPPEERALAFSETKRICKPGGTLAYAYINRIGAYLTGCFLSSAEYPTLRANTFALEQSRDDLRPELFYFTMPEEIAVCAADHGLTVLENVGVDYMFTAELINEASQEQLAAWDAIFLAMNKSSTCSGTSNHALMICKNDA
jgi:SAM-dependent methyltransferase